MSKTDSMTTKTHAMISLDLVWLLLDDWVPV